jgi:HK97 family phage major capsid protein
MDPIQTLREKAENLQAKSEEILNKAAAENRELTAEENATLDDQRGIFAKTMAEIDRREAIQAQAAMLSQKTARKAEPVTPAGVTSPSPAGATAVALPSDPGGVTITRPITAGGDDSGHWGFKKGFGEYLRAVAAARNGSVDPRLVKNAVSTYSGENTGADGGYALPPDFRAGVNKLLDTPRNIFPLLDQLQTPNFTVTLPMDEDPPWSSSGLVAQQLAEGGQLTPQKPVLKQLAIPLQKYGDLAYVTEEMLADGTLIGPYIQQKCADKIGWKVNAAVFNALMSSGSKITTTKGATGAGAPPTLINVQAMYVNIFVNGFQDQAVWLANPALITTFQGYTIGNWPAYLPPGGLSNAPYATLLGRPVIFTELCNASGSEGDLVLFAPKTIYGLTKTDGLRTDVSIHMAFDQDLTAYRFFLRAAIKSKFSASITRPDATTASNIVTLQTR